MEIVIRSINPTPRARIEERLKDPGFGRTFSDRMFMARWTQERGWYDAEIVQRQPLQLDPAAQVLHYAQQVFEGMKAHGWADGRVALFRPERAAERFERSTKRLCMPSFGVGNFLEAVETLVDLDRAWVPHDGKGSLYIRPTMIATEVSLGVKISNSYLFYIITGPAGPYFPTGFEPVKIYVEREYVRAVAGGLGAAKTASNYAASLLAARRAKEKGCAQVLFLDAKEHRYLEELGGMNVFCLYDDTLITPELSGSILPGITRDSILQMAKDLGLKAVERPLSIDEVAEAGRDGTMTEMFAVGTAAVVTPIGSLLLDGEEIVINDGRPGTKGRMLYERLSGIQYGRIPDPYGWVRVVSQRASSAIASSIVVS